MICALLNKASSSMSLASDIYQNFGVLVFQPASNPEHMAAEIGTCSLVPTSGVSCQNGSLFLPDLTNSASRVDSETHPHRDPFFRLARM